MPKYDGTGPMGSGAGTGWGRGPCGTGRGFSRGGFGGRRLGFRRFWNSTPSSKEEKEMLSEEESMLEQEIKDIKSRLVELKGKE